METFCGEYGSLLWLVFENPENADILGGVYLSELYVHTNKRTELSLYSCTATVVGREQQGPRCLLSFSFSLHPFVLNHPLPSSS